MSQPANRLTIEEIRRALARGDTLVVSRQCPMCDLVVRFRVTKESDGTAVEIQHQLPVCTWAEESVSNDWVKNSLFGEAS